MSSHTIEKHAHAHGASAGATTPVKAAAADVYLPAGKWSLVITRGILNVEFTGVRVGDFYPFKGSITNPDGTSTGITGEWHPNPADPEYLIFQFTTATGDRYDGKLIAPIDAAPECNTYNVGGIKTDGGGNTSIWLAQQYVIP